MEHFCTYFDHRFLPQGLALLESLRKRRKEFVLWVLCLDESCQQAVALLAAPEVRPIALSLLEAADPSLRQAKNNRSLIEYYFTCSPVWPLYLLGAHPEIRRITYLDADLFFFSDPQALLDATREASIAIIPHRFPVKQKERERFGRYNVGWISFRNDDHARACLRWWRQQCLEWCYDCVKPGRFADQKYLDEWPKRFKHVQIIDHKGANLAPWNLGNYQVKETPDAIMVDDKPLIFFHFHGVKRIRSWLYDVQLAAYGLVLSGAVRRAIYRPYLQALEAGTFLAGRLFEGQGINAGSDSVIERRAASKGSWVDRWDQPMRGLMKALRGILYRNYMLLIGEWIL